MTLADKIERADADSYAAPWKADEDGLHAHEGKALGGSEATWPMDKELAGDLIVLLRNHVPEIIDALRHIEAARKIARGLLEEDEHLPISLLAGLGLCEHGVPLDEVCPGCGA